MSDHPRDEWVDVTALGDTTPQRLLAVDGRELDIRDACDAYVLDRITIEELEHRIEEALR